MQAQTRARFLRRNGSHSTVTFSCPYAYACVVRVNQPLTDMVMMREICDLLFDKPTVNMDFPI